MILQNSVDKLTKASYDVENEVPVHVLLGRGIFMTGDSLHCPSKTVTLTRRIGSLEFESLVGHFSTNSPLSNSQ